ncbi:hypothetical protein Tco_0917678 [Tanacetum coccineum]
MWYSTALRYFWGCYNIDAGKYDELLSELTNEDPIETLEALVDESTIPSDPIVQFVDINKSTSYAGVAGGSVKDQPNVNSNFRTLVADPAFDGVNISIPRKVVEKVSTRFEHTLYGYFIGKRMAFIVKRRRGKTTGNSSKKDNLSMSNSFSALNEDEEDVENVYDESANLIQNTWKFIFHGCCWLACLVVLCVLVAISCF